MRVLEVRPDTDETLVEVDIPTGRPHQIRIHLAAAGHPLVGEPLYADTVSAVFEGWDQPTMPIVIGGRYGLSSKEFTPAMVKAVFDEIKNPQPKNKFTV